MDDDDDSVKHNSANPRSIYSSTPVGNDRHFRYVSTVIINAQTNNSINILKSLKSVIGATYIHKYLSKTNGRTMVTCTILGLPPNFDFEGTGDYE